jgi:hypothetical protein
MNVNKDSQWYYQDNPKDREYTKHDEKKLLKKKTDDKNQKKLDSS